MRSRLISTLLLLATTSGLPGAAAQEAGKAALRLCWEDTPKLPYLVLEKNQAPRGISVDLVTAILKRAGLAAEAVVWPWKRCLAEIAAGSIDLVPNASYTDDRTKFALFSKPLYRTHMAFFYDTRRFASPPVIEPHDNLKALRIGGVLMGAVAGVPGAASLTDDVCASAPLGDVRVSRAVLAALHAVVTRRELPSKPSGRRRGW